MTVILLFCFLLSCEDNKKTYTPPVYQESETFRKGKIQLEAMGYLQVKHKTYPLFCCSDSDSIVFSEGFTAKTKTGETVEGCFCAGWMKGVTIRFQ